MLVTRELLNKKEKQLQKYLDFLYSTRFVE